MRLAVADSSFIGLNESTMRGWFIKDSDGVFRLNKNTIKRWQENGPIVHTGRPSLLNQFPHLKTFIIEYLNGLRKASAPLNSRNVSAIIKGIVKEKEPDLLLKMGFCRSWCRKFLQTEMKWSYKRGTTSGQKLPADWKDQMLRMNYRVAFVIKVENILHPDFIINFDQTAAQVLQTPMYTYSEKKADQVSIVGMEDKRQITAVVGGTLAGELLPLQLIFAGQDHNLNQKKAVPGLQDNYKSLDYELKKEGWRMTQTSNHWSTLQSMKDYLHGIISPFVEKKKVELNAPNSHVVLIFDCWSVHKSEDFLTFLRESFPTYHPVFVPAGCTSKAQPADVIMQRPLKHGVADEFSAWMANEVGVLIRAGASPGSVKVDTGLVRMKPLLVKWLMSAWQRLKVQKALLKQGWSIAGFDKVYDAEFQNEALLKQARGELKTNEEVEDELESAADEEDDAVEFDGPEEKEEEAEEMNVEEALAAAVEQRPTAVGVRRSDRLSASAATRQERTILQLLQAEEIDEAILE